MTAKTHDNASDDPLITLRDLLHRIRADSRIAYDLASTFLTQKEADEADKIGEMCSNMMNRVQQTMHDKTGTPMTENDN